MLQVDRSNKPATPRERKKSGPQTAHKMSRDHFAVLRGWCQGLEARVLWNRYLIHLGPYDERRGRAFLRELLHELGALARRAGQPGFAGVLGRHKNRIADLALGAQRAAGATARPPAAPSLDDFAQQFPEDMYSEAELLELWKENYATPHPVGRSRQNAAQRRARLIERQLQALDWLERHACERPQASDTVGAWLEPRVSARLEKSGIKTLGEFQAFVARWGANWHKKVERVGSKGAQVIVAWLKNQASSLGPLPATALLPPAQLRRTRQAAAPVAVLGIAPLERLALPAGMATAEPGAPEGNRAPARDCRIDAANDLQAVSAWLALRPAGSHTWRAYRREAERFLLWSVVEAGKPLSALTASDCAGYRAFLQNPGCRWLGPRNAMRVSPDWRPLEGPLSASSIRMATVILQSMCAWLASQGYLERNPWNGLPKCAAASAAAPSTARSRPLIRLEWGWVEQWLGTLPQDERSARVRLLLELSYRCGVRNAELSAAKVEWLRQVQENGSFAWRIVVPGKGSKLREVALPSSALVVLRWSFQARGLHPQLLDNPPETPLIAGIRLPHEKERTLTPGRIYEVVRDALARCAAWIHPLDPNAGPSPASQRALVFVRERRGDSGCSGL